MRRVLLSSVFIVANLLSIQAQDALYIYRNDGSFNAFFYNEIDSIVYSKLDVDSILQSNYVVQEVWTADSTYRIPLIAIDSVGFVKPETIYANDVVKLDDLKDYVIKVDSLTIFFSQSIPSNLIPKKGSVLLIEKRESPFYDGFAGRVREITNGEYLQVNCDSVLMTDIYQQLIECIEFGDEKTSKARTRATNKIPLSWGSEVLGIGCSVEGNVTINTHGKFERRIETGKPVYIDMSITLDISSEASTKISGNIKKESNFGGFKIPIALPAGFSVQANITPVIEVAVNGSFENSFTTNNSYVIGYKYENGNGKGYFRAPKENHEDKGMYLSGGYSFFSGLKGSIGIYAPLNLAWLEASLRVGAYGTGDCKIVNTGINNNEQYERCKNDKITTGLKVDIGGSCGAGVENANVETTIGPWDIFSLSRDFYAFPLFSDLKVTEDRKSRSAKISSNVSRNLISPIQVGYAIFDKDNQKVDDVYTPSTYYRQNSFTNPLELQFKDLDLYKEYTCSPIVKLGEGISGTYIASPSIKIGKEIEVITDTVLNITYQNVDAYGYIISDDIDAIALSEYGICYTKTTDENWRFVKSDKIGIDGHFVSYLKNLEEDTEYYYCAYLLKDGNYLYGKMKAFKTSDLIVITEQAVAIDETSYRLHGRIVTNNINKLNNLEYGISYSLDTLQWNRIQGFNIDEQGNFSVIVNNLKEDTTYFYQAYVNRQDIIYGQLMTFRTKELTDSVVSLETGFPNRWEWNDNMIGTHPPKDMHFAGYLKSFTPYSVSQSCFVVDEDTIDTQTITDVGYNEFTKEHVCGFHTHLPYSYFAPNTIHSCYAYAIVNDKPYKGDTKYFVSYPGVFVASLYLGELYYSRSGWSVSLYYDGREIGVPLGKIYGQNMDLTIVNAAFGGLSEVGVKLNGIKYADSKFEKPEVIGGITSHPNGSRYHFSALLSETNYNCCVYAIVHGIEYNGPVFSFNTPASPY